MTETKKISLHDDVAALSTKISEGIKIDAKAATATAGESLYKDNLPEGLTMETVKSVSDYNTTFVAAGAHAFGEAAVAAMKGSKNLDRISVDIPMGVKDHVSYTVDRIKEVANRFGTGDATIIKHGVVTTSYEVRAGKNSGQLKAARQLIGELAASALAK